MKKIIGLIMLSLLFLGCTAAFEWEDGRLKAYYKMDEGSGAVIDISGNNNATNHGASNTTGKIFSGYYFNYSDTDYIISDSNVEISAAAAWSMNAWVNRSGKINGQLYTIMMLGDWGENDDVSAIQFGLDDSDDLSWTTYGGGACENNAIATGVSFEGTWHMITATYDGANGRLYVDGVNIYNCSTTLTLDDNPFRIGTNTQAAQVMNGTIDEVGLWNKTLTTDNISELYAGGVGLGYQQTPLTVTVGSPVNNTAISTASYNFTAVYYSISESFVNGTYFLWNSSGLLFNQTTVSVTGTSNTSTLLINGLSLGNYVWYVKACTATACVSTSNTTLIVGASVTAISYNSKTYETASESFHANFNVISGAEISFAQLVYNGTNYTISSFLLDGTNLSISKVIDIPVNLDANANQTNSFYFRFIYDGSYVQESSAYTQTSSFIKMIQCNGTYDIQALNFTILDETNQTLLNTTTNAATMKMAFRYWLGDGNAKKNYSYQQIAGANATFLFCISPWNSSHGFKTDLNSLFYASDFSENNYYLRNSSVTNISTDILLYLMGTDFSTKFFITIQEGVSAFTEAVVTVAKYFTGDGSYKTVAIKETDDQGEFVAWLDIDKSYRYSIVRDGILYATLIKQASCSASPCELTLQIDSAQGNIWEGYTDNFADNILSNISYDSATETVTYRFIDLSGLANYFRLQVVKGSYNTTHGETICDSFLYSSSGTLTCNVSGYEGDFIARGYISRSPEKLDQVISFVINALQSQLGIYAALFSVGFIITAVFLSAGISKGNPAAILISFGLALLSLKLMGMLPLGWVTVSVIELGVLYIAKLTKT